MFKKKKKELTEEEKEVIRTKSFFDMILPSTIKFSTDHYVCGDSYRCVWAIKEYPPTTEELALFSTLADRNNLTIHLYSRMVDAIEQRKIIQNATRKNKLSTGSNDVQENITAEGNLEDVVNLIAELRKNKEPLLHCAVFLELKADSMQKLRELQSEIQMELTRSKMSVDRLTLRQKEGFLTVLPVGYSLSVYSLQARLRIYIHLTIRARRILKVCLSAEINTAQIFLLILIGVPRIKPTQTV